MRILSNSSFTGKIFEKNKIEIRVICLFTDFYIFTSLISKSAH